MTGFDAKPVISGLTDFQRRTVAHVMDRFYGEDPVDRFLVADQTGLGKTLVARGVIARTIEELQFRPDIDRIDVVYVCSNQDLATQNPRKLNVTGAQSLGVASRLTMLGRHFRDFSPIVTNGPKSVNLVSFTPGTSFQPGRALGDASERAMLFLLLEQVPELALTGRGARTGYKLLKGDVTTADRFAERVAQLRWELGGTNLDEGLVAAFLSAIQESEADKPSLLERVSDRVGEIRRGRDIKPREEIAEMRAILARESIRLLTPDLVILDEFQRFGELLDENTDAGELAHHLFDYRARSSEARAKVLLLSATPFKPFTYAEESDQGESHHRDFMKVINFLASGQADLASRIEASLRQYRESVIAGTTSPADVGEVRESLLKVMTRTERPEAAAMHEEVVWPIAPPSAQDLTGFVALKRLAGEVGAPVTVEYWKAAPYFINFMDGYQIRDRVRDALQDSSRADAVRQLLAATQQLDASAIEYRQPVGVANSRLAALYERTIEHGWWKLLWMPPSLPYLEPGGAYAESDLQGMSKLLVFSSWAATPTAVASLLSYEADRLASATAQAGMDADQRAQDRRTRAARLGYRMRPGTDEPESLSNLALFWPMPGLAALGDPRQHARRDGATRSQDSVESELEGQLASDFTVVDGGAGSHWAEAFRRASSHPTGLTSSEIASAFSSDDDQTEDEPGQAPARLRRHVDLACSLKDAQRPAELGRATLRTLAELAAHSPGNIALRAVQRLCHTGDVEAADLWQLAARLSGALRSLFARPETTMLLDAQYPDEPSYWRRVLRVCADGNLQAVLDEYLHHVAGSNGSATTRPDELRQIVEEAVAALTLRPARYGWFDPSAPDESRSFPARFALRYGGRDKSPDAGARAPQVRKGFNSPFWPFVLASTSVGQEGIDFHWWCHSILHWNTPANPVDFEQREGRVDRYDGLAIRRNVAAAHGPEMLQSDEDDPWTVGYALAEKAHPEFGSLAPHWVYPGDAKIVRNVAPFELSVEKARLAQIKKDVARYRLTFGQPRQEDMMEILHGRLDSDVPGSFALHHLRIDLSAPLDTLEPT